MIKTYVVTWAQDATPVHTGFVAALKTFCTATKAKPIVVFGRYLNPTGLHPEHTNTYDIRLNGLGDDSIWASTDKEGMYVTPRQSLCSNLTVYGDISIQPTAVRPLTGFEVFCGESSGIFGHPKRALEVVPTATRSPRVLATTGACTIANYSKTKAGKKAEAHHVIGALVVEVDNAGRYFMRHITATEDGSFTDLEFAYTPQGVKPAPAALSVTLGDLHVGQKDDGSLKAARALVELMRPKALVLHDVLDFDARSHHRRKQRDAYARKDALVRDEVKLACAVLDRIAENSGAESTYVVRSNHDEHLERWCEEFDPRHDPHNAPYYHALQARSYRYFNQNGTWPDLFALEAARLNVSPKVKFLKRNESLKLGGVEHAFHGDSGINGSRGTAVGYAKLGVKVTIGHSHTPCIRDGVVQVGVTGKLDMGYNTTPSTWLHAHCVLHADGKRQLVIVVDGKFRAEQNRPKKGRAA